MTHKHAVSTDTHALAIADALQPDPIRAATVQAQSIRDARRRERALLIERFAAILGVDLEEAALLTLSEELSVDMMGDQMTEEPRAA